MGGKKEKDRRSKLQTIDTTNSFGESQHRGTQQGGGGGGGSLGRGHTGHWAHIFFSGGVAMHILDTDMLQRSHRAKMRPDRRCMSHESGSMDNGRGQWACVCGRKTDCENVCMCGARLGGASIRTGGTVWAEWESNRLGVGAGTRGQCCMHACDGWAGDRDGARWAGRPRAR